MLTDVDVAGAVLLDWDDVVNVVDCVVDGVLVDDVDETVVVPGAVVVVCELLADVEDAVVVTGAVVVTLPVVLEVEVEATVVVTGIVLVT